MIQGNYTSKALVDWKDRCKRPDDFGYSLNDLADALLLSEKLAQAQPFLLPSEGMIYGDTDRLYIPAHWKLPYPVTALEFQANLADDGDNRIEEFGTTVRLTVLLWETGRHRSDHRIPGGFNFHGDGIAVVGLSGSRYGWEPQFHGVLFHDKSFQLGELFPDLHDVMYKNGRTTVSRERVWEGYHDSMNRAWKMAGQFLSTLECKNVHVDDLPPPSRLQAKRMRDKKLPLITYKVLTIGDSKVGSTASASGSGTSPRTHLRRGHIRRLPTSTIWVNATVVKGSSGFVNKDYRMELGSCGAAGKHYEARS